MIRSDRPEDQQLSVTTSVFDDATVAPLESCSVMVHWDVEPLFGITGLRLTSSGRHDPRQFADDPVAAIFNDYGLNIASWQERPSVAG